MKYLVLIFILLTVIGCQNKEIKIENSGVVDSLKNEISDLQITIRRKEIEISNLKRSLANASNEDRSDYYKFSESKRYNALPTIEPENIKKLDEIELVDTLDIDPSNQFVFEHTTAIYQINDPYLIALLESQRQIIEGAGDTYYVKVINVCEEDGLPLETENCTDNIYIIIIPTELGYDSKLFKISRLYNSDLKELIETEDGFYLRLLHGKFPRKELTILIRPELIEFI